MSKNVTEETNTIQKNIILEGNQETEQESIFSQEEPNQMSINNKEKKVESPKQEEQQKVIQKEEKVSTSQKEEKIQEQEIQEQPIEEIKNKIHETQKCTDTKHRVAVGNSNKWFNNYNEAVSYYDNLINNYSNQVHSGQITSNEYNKRCPYGYETWSCPYCGKWTLNYYYR